MTVFADIADFDEDTRIDMIGKTVMSGPKSSADKPVMAAFVVENSYAKAESLYPRNCGEKFPGIRVIDRFAWACVGGNHRESGRAPPTMIGGLRHGQGDRSSPAYSAGTTPPSGGSSTADPASPRRMSLQSMRRRGRFGGKERAGETAV